MPAKKIIVAFLIIFVAVGGFVAGLFLLNQDQNIEEQAAVPGGQATVKIEPATGSFDVGETFTSSIFFNPANIAISGVAVRLTYPYTGSAPAIAVERVDINSSLLSSGDWTCPTKDDRAEGGNVVIDIACANVSASGFVSNQDMKLADITFRVNSQPTSGPVTMRFDPAESIIKQKSNGNDILLIPSSTGSYSVGGGGSTQSSPTPTQQQTTTSTPSPTTRLTSTPTPTGTTTVTATPSGTMTKGGEELPDAGLGYPTILGAGLGMLVILGAMLLAL